MAPDSVWEIVFLMVILKIPILYLCGVIWYAIKAEPTPEAGAAAPSEAGPDDDSGPRRGRRRFPRPHLRPHGGPSRRPTAPQPSFARAEIRRK